MLHVTSRNPQFRDVRRGDDGILTLADHGAEHHDGAALPLLGKLQSVLACSPTNRPGLRLHGRPDLASLLTADRPIGALAASTIGAAARPVRAILFDKSPGANWALGWHQDRTVAVRSRQEVAGWGPWSVKAGVHMSNHHSR